MGVSYVAQPPREGTSTALIVLIVLLCFILLGMGGCMLCVCVGAAANK
jgi:hypothetical protein